MCSSDLDYLWNTCRFFQRRLEWIYMYSTSNPWAVKDIIFFQAHYHTIDRITPCTPTRYMPNFKSPESHLVLKRCSSAVHRVLRNTLTTNHSVSVFIFRDQLLQMLSCARRCFDGWGRLSPWLDVLLMTFGAELKHLCIRNDVEIRELWGGNSILAIFFQGSSRGLETCLGVCII